MKPTNIKDNTYTDFGKEKILNLKLAISLEYQKIKRSLCD